MAVIRAVIGVALAAFAIWMTVQIVNCPDRREWISRNIRPVMLKLLIGYFIVSALTLPFLDQFWLGEMPPLAVIQLPKMVLARWCQGVVMRGMQFAGLSRGSMSPDLIASRPWGLLLAYVLGVGPVFVVTWFRTRMAQPYGRTTWILAAVAVIDFILMLLLAGGPGLTIY